MSSTQTSSEEQRPVGPTTRHIITQISDEPVVPRPKRGTWIIIGLIVLFLAMVAHSFITNHRFGWPTVVEYIVDPRVLKGILMTLQLTFFGMVVGIVVGVPIAIMRLSSNFLVSTFASAYIWFFRSVPLLVQIIFWGFAAALYPRIVFGVPFGGPEFFSLSTNDVISFSMAAILALGLNEAAYLAEIVRAGITSVPRGQEDASNSLGFTRLRTLQLVILPQAMRFIIPPVGNNTIMMLKSTSLCVFIGVVELLGSVQLIYAENFKQIPLLIVAVFWYMVMTTILSVVQSKIEKHYGKGFQR